jgi:hypothetical protein
MRQSILGRKILKLLIAVSADTAVRREPQSPAFRLKHSIYQVVDQPFRCGEILERLPIILAYTVSCPKPQIPLRINRDGGYPITNEPILRRKTRKRLPIVSGRASAPVNSLNPMPEPEIAVFVLGDGSNRAT